MNKRTLGSEKEQIAQTYLASKGFIPLEQNFFISGGEIDLIMKDKEFIVFIEVKSLDENSEFSIYETITKSKKRFLKRAINNWLLKNDKVDAVWRVDFVGIVGQKLEHFEFLDLN